MIQNTNFPIYLGKRIKHLIQQLDVTLYLKKLHPATQYKIKNKKHPRMTQAIFSELMGMDESQVRKLFSSGIKKTKTLEKISNVLEIPILYLIQDINSI